MFMKQEDRDILIEVKNDAKHMKGKIDRILTKIDSLPCGDRIAEITTVTQELKDHKEGHTSSRAWFGIFLTAVFSIITVLISVLI